MMITSNTRTAEASAISSYDTTVRGRIGAGHVDIRAYSGHFKVLASTAAVDARAHTGTGGAGTGIPIHWLNGAKVANNYNDFYDGSWSSTGLGSSGRDENGDSVTFGFNTQVWTGSTSAGIEAMVGGTGRGLGRVMARVGRPGTATPLPLDGLTDYDTAETKPLYGLSDVFEVSTENSTITLAYPAA